MGVKAYFCLLKTKIRNMQKILLNYSYSLDWESEKIRTYIKIITNMQIYKILQQVKNSITKKLHSKINNKMKNEIMN